LGHKPAPGPSKVVLDIPVTARHKRAVFLGYV